MGKRGRGRNPRTNVPRSNPCALLAARGRLPDEVRPEAREELEAQLLTLQVALEAGVDLRDDAVRARVRQLPPDGALLRQAIEEVAVEMARTEALDGAAARPP